MLKIEHRRFLHPGGALLYSNPVACESEDIFQKCLKLRIQAPVGMEKAAARTCRGTAVLFLVADENKPVRVNGKMRGDLLQTGGIRLAETAGARGYIQIDTGQKRRNVRAEQRVRHAGRQVGQHGGFVPAGLQAAQGGERVRIDFGDEPEAAVENFCCGLRIDRSRPVRQTGNKDVLRRVFDFTA